MSAQIFKNNIPNNILFNLLESICIKNDKYYIFNAESFKKGMFNGFISEFITLCIPYYHLSKRKYLERKVTYNSVITVLRQICKFNKITYTSKILYDKSKYCIVYYIYFV